MFKRVCARVHARVCVPTRAGMTAFAEELTVTFTNKSSTFLFAAMCTCVCCACGWAGVCVAGHPSVTSGSRPLVSLICGVFYVGRITVYAEWVF